MRLRDGFGTFAWISHQDRLNAERMGTLPSLDELFAKASSAEVVSWRLEGGENDADQTDLTIPDFMPLSAEQRAWLGYYAGMAMS